MTDSRAGWVVPWTIQPASPPRAAEGAAENWRATAMKGAP